MAGFEKRLIYIAASISFVSHAFAVGTKINGAQLGLYYKYECPYLTQKDLEALTSQGYVKKRNPIGKEEEIEVKIAMDLAEFKKQIPNKLNAIGAPKTFRPTTTMATRQSDGHVRLTCIYPWQSTVSKLTRNKHEFNIYYDTKEIYSYVDIRNMTDKPLTVSVLKKGSTTSLLRKITMGALKTQDFDFLQEPIDGGANVNSEFIVKAEFAEGAKVEAACENLFTGNNYEITFKGDSADTARCVAQEIYHK